MKLKAPSFLRRDEEEATNRRDAARREARADEHGSVEGDGARVDARAIERVVGNRMMRRLLRPSAVRPDDPAGDGTEAPAGRGTERSAGRPLDMGVRGRMERALGTEFGDVRIHTDEGAAAEVRRHGAEAMAIGNHVAFEHGRYRPGTPLGDALLAHELAHTVQQREGATGQIAAAPAHRLEADANRSALGAVVALWGRATSATGRVGAGVGPRLRSGTQMRFFFCEAAPVYKPPDYLGPHSRQALDEISDIMKRGKALQQMIVIGTVLTTATSAPQETLASGSYDVRPQAEALRAVPVIVRSRVIEVITLLLVEHENDMNEQERQFWRNILRQFEAL